VLDSAGSNFLPNSLASNGTDVWIGEFSGSLTEVNADTGKLVENLPAAYGLNDPTAIAAFGSALWVANNGNNSVTELSPR
jgi:hypothetical protein